MVRRLAENYVVLDGDDLLIDPDNAKSDVVSPAPTMLEIVIDGKEYSLRYDKAFVLGCDLLENGRASDAAKLFERLEEFVDRGPRAFIMQAFCEAAAMKFQQCNKPLEIAFDGDDGKIAEALREAFVSYHVGIRQDALKAMAELVNAHHELPTLCLLLGNMLNTAGNLLLARKCWSLAIHRDRTGGAVAAAAMWQLRRLDAEPSRADRQTEHDRSNA